MAVASLTGSGAARAPSTPAMSTAPTANVDIKNAAMGLCGSFQSSLFTVTGPSRPEGSKGSSF